MKINLQAISSVSDPIKKSTPGAISKLKKENIRVVMLTGDNEKTAGSVAARLNIDDVISGVLPDQKAEKVKEYSGERTPGCNGRRRD